MRRLLNNLFRLPLRTWRGFWQWTQPAYRLQAEAERHVAAWLTPSRKRELAGIPSFSSERELNLLAHLATIGPPGGAIVEIGAYKGRSTAWLVEAVERRADRPAVVSIDPHLRDTWDTFCGVVERFKLRERGLQVMRALSRDAGRDWTL